MNDIFVNYAAEDRSDAQKLAASLRAQGWSVWWDREIPAGSNYFEVITRELTEARCVIVLWTSNSVENGWVREEATRGKQKILIPVALEKVDVPLGFGSIQAAQLFDWDGTHEHPAFQKLLADIATHLGCPATPEKPPFTGDQATSLTVQIPPGLNLRHTLRLDGSAWSVAVSADGRRAVSGGPDKTVNYWDLESGRLLRSLRGHIDTVHCVAVTGDGRWVASGGKDKMVKLWDPESGEVVRSLSHHRGAVWSLSLSADGRRAVSGSADQTVKVWDVSSGHLLHSLKDHRGAVYAVAISPDGRRAVSGAADNTVRVWDLEDGRLMHCLEGHSDNVYSVAVSDDGLRAVSGSADGTVKVWHLEGGQLVSCHTYIVAMVQGRISSFKATTGGRPDEEVQSHARATGKRQLGGDHAKG